MPKAVIFDVDGTLVDSVDQHTRAWVNAFRDYGHELAFADVPRQIGKGGDQLMPVFLNKAALDRLQGIRRKDVLVVGDTPYDAEAAGKARLRNVGVLCGGFFEQSLRDAGCIAIYHDPADLLAHYDHSPLAEDRAAI